MSITSPNVEDLAAKIREMESEFAPEQADSPVADLAGLTGLSEEELQDFLENKSGISPDEEAQGSVMAAAVTVAAHC